MALGFSHFLSLDRIETFKIFGQLDIGQSMIIQNERILGLESVEGTNELIKRCFSYKKQGDKAILVKLSKYDQSRILDIPTIGVETMKLLNKFDYEGIFLCRPDNFQKPPGLPVSP